MAAEQQRVQAEIQSRLMVAKSCPRDEVDALDRIKTACERPGLAENSEYSYSRGGTEINGPTIDLLRVIANCWGNIDYGFRELSQANGESTIESYAWELETNAKNTKVFTVPHKRYTKQGSYALTDPRDIYETVANNAERRVRACLEAIIPPDVVDTAVSQCRDTLRANADVTPDSIKKLVAAFGALGVKAEQVEKRLGRRLDTMQPAQLVSLRRIYKSIQDGMSKPADWFEMEEAAAPQSAVDSAKDALRKKAEPPAPVDAGERPQNDTSFASPLAAEADIAFQDAEGISDVEAIRVSLNKKATTPEEKQMLLDKAAARTEELRASKGKK